jgi:HEAT repeat protein
LERSHSTLRALTLYFEQHPGGVDKRVLQVLWAGPQNRLRPEVLRLTLAILPDMARDLARLNITSTTVFLRAASMEILILSGDHSILEAALSDESAVVRRRAVYAIGEAMNGADSKALLIRASLDESPLVREAVLEVAGRGQIRAVRDTVVKALADPYDFVRESAVYALKEVDSPVNAANMVAALIRDPSPQVREAAFRVLERGGRFPPDEVTIGALRDPRPAVAASAVNALGDVTSHGIDDALIEWLARPDAPSSAVMAALRVVGQHHPKAAAEVIARYLDNGNPDLVAEAVIALQRIGLPETAQWLAPLVTHPSTDVRERTVYALAQIGGPGAPEALSLAVWDGAATIRARAIYALARLQYTAARDLVAAIPSGSREVDAAKLYFENTVGKARKHNHAKRSRSV